MKEMHVPVRDGQLYCQVYGHPSEKTPVVVVHGGPGLSFGYLLPQMSAIEKFCYAVFYDQRGTGRSTSTDAWQQHPFETYTNDLEETRKALNSEKIILLAHSFGGVFASSYAIAYPNCVEKIIYVNSVPLSSAEYLDYVAHRVQIVEKNKSVLDALRNTPKFLAGDPEIVERYYRIYFKDFFYNPALLTQLSLKMTQTAARNNFAIYDFFYCYIQRHSFDFRQKLIALNKPTLIITAENDVIPLHYLSDVHATLPSSRYAMISQCGHFPYIEQPTILFELIKDFLC